MTDWLDISLPLRSRMAHWPGDPPVEIERACSIDSGSECNLTTLRMSAHTGTHVDAPLHYIPGGAAIDEAPADALIGPARVVAVEADAIGPELLDALGLEPGARVLFRTSNSERCRGSCFRKRFVHVTPAGARWLVERGVRTVGIDYLSIGACGSEGDETHRILLAAEVWIIEGLDLARVGPGLYELLCLPLRIEGADGAPARAFLRALP